MSRPTQHANLARPADKRTNTERSHLGGESEAANKDSAATKLGSDSTLNRLQDAAALCRGYAVVQVRKDDKISRHVYLSLHSAVKAQQRAERAGREAVLVLCELVPVLPAPVRLVDGAIKDPLGRIVDAASGEVVA